MEGDSSLSGALLIPALTVQKVRIPVMRVGVPRIQLDGLLQRLFDLLPLPLHLHGHRQRGIRLGQSAVQLQSFQGRPADLGNGLLLGVADVARHDGIDIGQAGIGLGIIRIQRDGLFKILDGLVEIFLGPLVP